MDGTALLTLLVLWITEILYDTDVRGIKGYGICTWWRYLYTQRNDRFSVNLDPFGPGRAVVEAARKSIDQIGNYPDASCRKLKSALAKRLGSSG